VLTEEGIAERGNHKDLLNQKGIYANLYALTQAKQ
jgi:ABC-type multidrug transport system fused ATPase/permease subunit